MAKSYHLSPEVLEEIFIHTLDYSYQLNNLQLKRLQLVSIAFNGVATRLLYRHIRLKTQDAFLKLYRRLVWDENLRCLVRSISYEGPTMPTSITKELLPILPMCTSFPSSKSSVHQVEVGKSFSPSVVSNTRLAHIVCPSLSRPSGIRPIQRRQIVPSVENPEAPLVQEGVALHAISNLPSTVTHLVIAGQDIIDFVKTPESVQMEGLLRRRSLTSVEIHGTNLCVQWLFILLIRGLNPLAATSIRMENMDSMTYQVVGLILERYGQNVAHLALSCVDRCVPADSSMLIGLEQLRTLALDHVLQRDSWFKVPTTLEQLRLDLHGDFGETAMGDLLHFLRAGHHTKLKLLSVIGTDTGTRKPAWETFPSPRLLRHPPASGLDHLRLEDVAVNEAVTKQLITFCSPSLRYLALHDIEIGTPWIAIAKCAELRWLEVGSIKAFLRNASPDSEESEEEERAAEPLVSYSQRRRTAKPFLAATFPCLDYLSIHVADSFSLLELAHSISIDHFPSLKFVNLEGMRKSGIYENDDIKWENAKGLEKMLRLKDDRGFTLTMDGKSVGGVAELWMIMNDGAELSESEDYW